MGRAAEYTCPECGYRADGIVDDFSFGFSGDVMVAVVCAEHGLMSAGTGINVMHGEMPAHPKQHYACPACGVISPCWNHKSCPKCGSDRIERRGLLHDQVTVSVTRPDWPVWS